MRCSRRIETKWGGLDFVVHSLAYSDRAELKGRYADTTRENFLRSMVISAFSFTEIAKRAAPLMQPGGALLTLSFAGANRVMPNYNVMGVAKAALEASVRYLAADYGPQGIRVNAISAGLIRTLAGAGIADGRVLFNFRRRIRRCAAASTSPTSAAPRFIFCRLFRAASPEKSIMWTPATISFSCRIPTA